MRQHPIGTGPFKFVEFKPNESIKLTRNPDYWKPGRPYLDGIEYTIIRNASTWILALGAHQFDRNGLGFVPISLLKEIKNQAPGMSCEIASWNTSRVPTRPSMNTGGQVFAKSHERAQNPVQSVPGPCYRLRLP
jgi:peptide/nickel transport system substrate-binding protein